ncbi:MAG: ribonuclease P protein component 1 [Candidatus Aenigmarchaeota archaeon]|nr:ribonuclease P protein component 1 [Candidatus Aenigmarchaeota archaeon]
MPITPQNLVRHELIGLKVSVSKSSDPTQEGLSGTVVDESYGVLTVDVAGKDKKVVKSSCVFVFTLPDRRKVEVDGKVIVSRPEDRIKKKQPKW